MRKIYALLVSLVLFTCASVNAQIAVTVTGSTNTTPNLAASYTSLAGALTDLNATTAMTGPVTLTLASGTETAPANGGFTVGSSSLNPLLSATNTVTIQKGSGATPVLQATATGTATAGSAAPDGILALVGADYVTIDGLTLTDPNTTNPAAVEFGIGLFKRAAGDGCNNNTVKNCIINVQRVNNGAGAAPMLDGAVGILVINSTNTAAITALTPTNGGTNATNGTNSNNKFYSNTINGGNIGIGLSGYAASTGVGPTPTATTFLGDLNNDIGGTGASGATTGNSILNYGGGAATNAAAGIRANNQWSLNVGNNIVNNNNGSGVNHATTLRGIYLQAGTSANVSCTYNTVTIKGGGTTSQLSALENAIGSTAASNTITITNNTIQNCTYTTGTSAIMYCILSSASATTANINNNIIQNNAFTGATTSGTFYGISNSGTNTTTNCNSNQITGNSIGVSGSLNSATMYGIYNSAASTNYNANSNTISNNSLLNSYGSIYVIRGNTSTITVDGNTISNITIPNNASSTSSLIYGYYDVASPVIETVTNNNINNLTMSGSNTSTSNTIYGIYNVTASGAKNFSGNNINNLTFTSSGAGYASVIGIRNAYTNTSTISKNTIHTLSSTGTTPTVAGIHVGGTTATVGSNISNNLIGNLSTPASTGHNLFGIFVGAVGTNHNIYYNTIYLNGTSTGTGFASSAVYMSSTTPTVTLNNNILVNLSTPTGTGITAAVRRTATALTGYGSTSNNNLFYAGTPSATNVLYYDGTTGYQTMATYKTQVSPRESASVSEAVSSSAGTFFQSLTGPATGTSSTFLHLVNGLTTQAESGGTPISGYTDDYDGNTRNATKPDIGADEFNGTSPSPTVTLNSFYVAGTSTAGTTTQCTATGRDVSVNAVATAGTVSSVTITYNNGAGNTTVAMNGTTGTASGTFTYTIPAASPTNTTVTWSVTVTNSGGLTATYTGATYADDPLNGVTATVTASSNPVCSGSSTTLTAALVKLGTAQVGTGTSLTSATTQPTAFCNRWPSYRMQLLYTASELTAAGLGAGNITAIGFNITSLGDAATNSSFRVKMGNTALTALTTFVDTTTGFTSVYPAQTYTHTASGIQTITLATPYNWDGASNIIVQVVMNGANLTNNSTTYYTATSGNTVAYTSTAATDAASLSTNRLNTYFTGSLSPAIQSVSWSNGATGTSTSVSPTANTSYTATVTASGCTVASSPYLVTIKPLPTAPNTVDGSQCGAGVPTSATVSSSYGTANGTAIFNWYYSSAPTTLLQSSTSLYYSSSISSGSDFLVAEQFNGCEGPKSPIRVDVSTPGAFSITGSQTICNGAIVQVLPSGTYDSITWVAPAGTLFTDGAATVAYTAGRKAASVYFKSTTAGANAITATAYNTSTTCGNTATTTFTVQPGGVMISSTNNPICQSGASVLSASPSTGYDAALIKWQISTDGTSYTDIAGATGVTYNTGTLTATRYYKFVVSNTGSTACQQPTVTVTVNNPLLTSTTPGSRCGPGTVNLTAAANAGAQVNWYAASTGGSILYSGTTYTTPSLSATTTYYAAAATAGSVPTVTVGTGATTTSTTGVTPFSVLYEGAREQYLIKASELQALGLTAAATLNSLSFTVTSAGSYTQSGFTIKLANTASTTVGPSFGTPIGSFTTVYGPVALTTPSVGTKTFTFATPFAWDGSSNILVDICHDNDINNTCSSCYGSNSTVAYTATSFNSVFGTYGDNAQSCGTTSTSTISTYTNRPNMTFGVASCESSRTAVIATINTPPVVTISTPGNKTVICNGASVDLTASSTNTNYTYSWSNAYNGATQTVTPASNTTYTVTATDNTTGNTNSGCINTASVSIGVQPVANIAASPEFICGSGTSVLSADPATGYAAGGSLQWQSSTNGTTYSDIATATGVTYTTPTLSSTTYYKLLVKDGAGLVCSQPTQTITVSSASVTGTTPANRCGTGTVTLAATGSAGSTMRWYTVSTGGTPVATGNSYTTPVISATTTYYVAASAGLAGSTGGSIVPSATTLTGTPSSNGLVFNSTQPFTLEYVTVYSASASSGTVIVGLYDNTGSLLQSAAVAIGAGSTTTPVAYRLPLGFSVPQATGLRLLVVSAPALVYETAGVSYPYGLGANGSITSGYSSGVTATTYYYLYKWEMTVACESARSAVVATVNPATAITVSANRTVSCSGAAVNLSATSTNPDYQYTWTPGNLTGATVTVNPTANTTYTVTATDANTNCAQTGTIGIEIQPTPSLSAAPASICRTGSTTISASPSTGYASGGSLQWQSSTTSTTTGFTNISGATSTTYTTPTLSTTTYYRLQVLNGSGTVCSQPVITVAVNNPTVTGTTPGTRCGTGTVNLSAAGGAGSTLQWYAASTGGAPLATGNTFTTPSISATTTYYVSAIAGGSTITGGKTGTNGADGANTGGGIYFTANTAFTLNSVQVYPTASGLTTISLFSGSTTSGTSVLPAVAYTFTAAQVNTWVTIPINWAISTPGNYTIYANGVNMWRDYSASAVPAIAYPYNIGSAVTLTNGSLSGYYYFFYNWSITTGCESASRTAVVATVNTPPAINATGTATICQGNSTALNVTSSNAGYTYTWTPGNLSGASQTVSPASTTTYTVNAVDNSGGANAGCSASAAVTVTVTPRPTPVTISPNTTAYCSAPVQLVASGGLIPGTGVTTGTSPSTSQANYSPFYTYYEGVKKQYLITAAELTAMGMVAGSNLNSVSFNVASQPNPGAVIMKNLKINGGLTTATDLSSAFVTTVSNLYTASSPYTVVTGANTFTFTSNITWNGTSNVVIEVCHDNDPDGTCGTCYQSSSTDVPFVSMNTTTFTSSRVAYQDNSTTGTVRDFCGTPGSASTATSTSRPVMTLGITTPGTIVWSPVSDLYTDAAGTVPYTGQNVRTVYATPSATTDYTAAASNGSCAGNTPGTARVNVGAALTVTAASSSPSSCGGSTVTISSTVGGGGAPYTYSWSDGSTVVSTAASFNVTPTSTTTYTLTVTDNCSNSASDAVTVSVNPLPTASVSPSGSVSICAPATQTLTASTNAGSPSYQWKLNSGIITGATSSTYTASSTGNYSVIVTNTATGCSATSSAVSVTVNPAPTPVTVTPNTTSVCGNASARLTANGGLIPASGSVSGTTVTTSTGSESPFYRTYEGAHKQYLITASELTALGLVSGSTVSSVSFNVTAVSAANLNFDNFNIKAGLTTATSLTAFASGTSMVYTAPGGSYTPVVGTNSFSFSTPLTWNGTSNVVLEVCFDNDPANTCSGCWGGTVTVTSATAPGTYSVYYYADNTAGPVRDMCTITTVSGSTTTRPVIGMSFTQPTNVIWTPQTDLYLDTLGTTPYTGTATRTVFAKPSATTTYTATATSSAGCGSSAGTATVNVGQALTAIASASPAAICNGSSTTVSASASGGGSPYTYSWSDGTTTVSTAASFTASPVTTTTYTVTVTGSCGTSTTSGVTVTVTPLPTVSISPAGPVNICSPGTTLLTATTNAASPTYVWKLNGGTLSGNSSTYTASITGSYTVVVTSGTTTCSNTSSPVTVNINPKPSTVTVTPNSATACAGSVQQLTASGGGVATTGTATGTSPTTANTVETPFYRGNEGSRHQYVITAAELTAMGASAGNKLNAIAFNVTSLGASPNSFLNFTMKAGLSATTLTSGFITTGLTTVYGSTTYTPFAGVNTFNFTTALTWDGTSNLVIEICYDNDPNGSCSTCTGNSSTVSVASKTGGLSRYVASDNAIGVRSICSITTGSVLTNTRPVITVTFTPTGTFKWTPATGLYTDAGATTAYVAGSTASTVYAKVTSNTVYTATATSAAGCSSSGTSAIYTTTAVTPTVNITITNGSNPSCTGATLTFTGTPANGGSAPTYQWYKNATAITGATALSYTGTGFITGDQIKLVMISSLGCTTSSTATSNIITMTVNPNQWTGASTVNNSWNNADNWCGGVVPSATTDAIIPSGLAANKYPVLSADASVRNLTLQSGATLSLLGRSFNVKGTLLGTGGFIGRIDAKLTISSAGTTTNLNFASGGNLLGSLTVAGTGSTVVNVAGVLDIYDELNVSAGILNTGGSLTIKSTASATGRVAPVGGTISGAVTVERFIPSNGHRAWRLLSVPTQTTQTFHQSWQENQAPMVVGTPGLGTLITGPQGTANYFDAVTASPSLLRFNQVTGAQGSFGWVTRTDSAMATTSGYFLFIRGDRSIPPTGSPSAPNTTTLRTNGPLYIGTQTAITLPANTNVLVGNIYASAVDFATMVRTNVTSFKVWDPKLLGTYNVGAYQTFSASNGYDPVPGGGSYGSTPNSRIESGQAFIVSSSTGGSIQFTEAAKTTGSRNVFRTNSTVKQFKTNLYAETQDGPQLADGNSVVFDDAYTAGTDEGDVVKAGNLGEDFAISSNHMPWVIESRKSIGETDVIQYSMKKLRTQEYTLEFLPKNMAANITGYLEDKFTGSKTSVSMTDATTVRFTVTADAASKAEDRFRIVFSNKTLPVMTTEVKAYVKNKDVQVDWKVKAEQNVHSYEVEHSADGNNFSKATSVAARANAAAENDYGYVHTKAVRGDNWYRIRTVSITGEAKYTNAVKVTIGKESSGFNIYPNPIVNSRVNVEFKNQAEGKYTINLVDKTGAVKYSTTVSHTASTNAHSLALPSSLAAGTYQIEIVSNEGDRSAYTVIIANK